MLNVSEATQKIYFKDGVHKTYRLVFPDNYGVTYTNENIVKDSIRVKESISSGDSLEFVGCIASSLSIKVKDLTQYVKGSRVELYVKAGDTEEIPLFKGIVDSVSIQSDRRFKEIIAYDALYKFSQKDISNWYLALDYPISMGEIRKSLLNELGLVEDENISLPNDNIVITENKYEPNELKAISVLKSFCQANGCFGIIGRDGRFKWRYLLPGFKRVFPGDETYPSNSTIPVKTSNDVGYSNFDYYKKLEYQEYSVKPVDNLIIRQTESDIGITVGSGVNRYIIQNNMFLSKLEESVKQEAANNILNKINNISYHPVDMEVQGLPYLECGDIVTVAVPDRVKGLGELGVDTFIVLEREIRGDQILTDRYFAEGSEEQKTFITDIQAQLNDIKDNGAEGDLDDYYTADEVDTLIDDSSADTKDYVDTAISQMETPTGFKIVSCKTLPANRDANTLYLIHGAYVVR